MENSTIKSSPPFNPSRIPSRRQGGRQIELDGISVSKSWERVMAASSTALRALDAQHIELADQVRDGEGAATGHGDLDGRAIGQRRPSGHFWSKPSKLARDWKPAEAVSVRA